MARKGEVLVVEGYSLGIDFAKSVGRLGRKVVTIRRKIFQVGKNRGIGVKVSLYQKGLYKVKYRCVGGLFMLWTGMPPSRLLV